MRSGGGKNERYYAAPPPPGLYQQSPVSRPKPRSPAVEGRTITPPGFERDGDKKTRRKPNRRSKQFPNGVGSLDEGPYPGVYLTTTASSSSYVPQIPNGYLPRGAASEAGTPTYKNGRFDAQLDMQNVREKLSPYKNKQTSPARFTSPVQLPPPRFHSDVNQQLMKDAAPPQLFADYWPLSKVNEELEKGRVFSCTLRVNPHNRNEGYATIDGLSVDVLIDGSCAQNRAFDGDVVALLLQPPHLWPKLKGGNGSRATNGNVVAPSHTFASDGNGQASEVQLEGECSYTSESVGQNHVGMYTKDRKELDDCVGSGGLEMVQAMLADMPGRRPTGKVVAILKKSSRREAVVGFLSIRDQAGGRRGEKAPCGLGGVLTLGPVDAKFPKMIVSANSLPDEVAKKLHEGDLKIRSEILAAFVERWETDSPYPHAVVTHSLGQAGEFEAQKAAILFEHAVHSAEFPPEALACLPHVPWEIPRSELRKRRDLRSLRIFSIDPATARDLDDALSVEHLRDGLIRVGVHIADVSFFVRPGSDLDKEAQQRSTSFYLFLQVLPMLPRLLCEELCSLNPGVDRLAFSVIWDINATGDVVHQWIGKTVIRSCCKLSYGDAQDMLDGSFGQKLQSGETLEPWLSDGVSWDEVISDVMALQKIAKLRRDSRFQNGALRLDNGKLVFSLDDEGIPCDSTLYEQKESNMLVEEFMLLANMTVAKVISTTFPDCALLRRHPEPNSRKLKEFEDFCKKNGFKLNTESAATLHSSLEMLKEELKDDPVLFSILLLYATKPMQLAKYFCTGQAKDGDWGHYALATPVYTHFTSPIRRYPDLVVHRTLAAALEAESALEKNLTGPTAVDEVVSTRDYEVLQQYASKHQLLEPEKLAVVVAHCNERKLASRNVQDATDRLCLWAMLRNKQGLFSDACIVALGPKFMCLYVSKIAMERRVYYDDVEGLKVDWLENTGTLILDCSRSKHQKKVKSRSITDVLAPFQDSDPEGETDLTIQPEALPLTLRPFGHLPVLLLASGGDSSPLDIGVRLYVTSYLI